MGLHDMTNDEMRTDDLPSCAWTYDYSTDAWDTSCGQTWQFTTGGPDDNNVRFCHWCGLRVRKSQ